MSTAAGKMLLLRVSSGSSNRALSRSRQCASGRQTASTFDPVLDPSPMFRVTGGRRARNWSVWTLRQSARNTAARTVSDRSNSAASPPIS
jgi:hypothetical protein